MKLILLVDVPKLGSKGKVIDVSDGYARNYLLPKGLAVEASEARLKELDNTLKRSEQKKEKEEDKARKTAAIINQRSITIKAKCGDGGKLFGAITSKEISEAILSQFKVNVDKKKIEVKEPMRHLGEYSVTIKLHPAVHVDMNVVVKEQ
ncbi:MAG: 50S ribosomal protein L9 [Chitinophagales bacterium]